MPPHSVWQGCCFCIRNFDKMSMKRLRSKKEIKRTKDLIRPSGTFPIGEGWFTAQPLNSLAFPYGEGGLPQARRMRSFAPKISL